MSSADRPVVRWGIVGTGSIANKMAAVIGSVPSARLAAVSSRNLSSAEAFAARHGAGRGFDSWQALSAWDGIDAVYVATPTGFREDIAIAAAANGKHVLAEKPFTSLGSVQRITDACRDAGVGFMDGTHFGHHPRTSGIRADLVELIGKPRLLDSMFQFSLPDRNDIRYDPALEPLGAIGDVGWYCMRAIVEYLPAELELVDVVTMLCRDEGTGAVVRGSGTLRFDDDTLCSWNCGFDAGAVITHLRLSGEKGVITVDDFVANNPDGSADYRLLRGGWETWSSQSIRTPSPYTSRQLMFENFARMIGDPEICRQSVARTLRTQALLDAIWTGSPDVEGR